MDHNILHIDYHPNTKQIFQTTTNTFPTSNTTTSYQNSSNINTMKAFTILASFSVVALAAALPKPQASSSFPTVTIQFFKGGEPFENPINVTVGAISDREIEGPDAAAIVNVVDESGSAGNVAGAENTVCVFTQNGGSTIAGQATLEEPVFFGEEVKRITRTTCEF